MINRFKGLDLIDRVHEELWMAVHDIVQEAVIKTILKKKKCKKVKWLSEETLQIAEEKKKVTNRFKGLDLIVCLKNYGLKFVPLNKTVIKTIPKKKNATRQNRSFKEALQTAEKRREAKSKGEKERCTT